MAEQPEMDEKYFDELVKAQARAEKAKKEKERTISGWIAETFDRTLKQNSPEAMVEELYWSTLAMPLDLLNWWLDHLPDNKEDEAGKSPAAAVAAARAAAATQNPSGAGQLSAPVVVGQAAAGQGAPVVVGQTADQSSMTPKDVREYVGLYLRLNELIADKMPPAEYAKLGKQALPEGRQAIVLDKKAKAAIKQYLPDLCADPQVRAYTRNIAGKDLAGAAQNAFIIQQTAGKGLDTAARSQPILKAPDRRAVERELKRADGVQQQHVQMLRDNQALKRARQDQQRGQPDPRTRSNGGRGS